MKAHIRPFQPQDKQALCDIFSRHIPQYFGDNELSDFMEYLAHYPQDYYVLTLDEQVIGGGGFWINEAEQKAGLTWGFVAPEHMKLGLGKQLATFRLQKIKDSGKAKTVHVETSQHGWQFFEKLGFEFEEMEKDYWAEGLDLYVGGLKVNK